MGWSGILKKVQKRVEHLVLPQAIADARAEKRAAVEIWENDCQWRWTNLSTTGIEWLSTTGKFNEAALTRFNHISAHNALGHNAVVDHWVDLLDAKSEVIITKRLAVIYLWANIGHDKFWQKMAHVFEQIEKEHFETPFHAKWEPPWSHILEKAGVCGNLAPYRCCPRSELMLYSSGIMKPHPAVGLWLEQEGLATKEQLVSWVNEDTMPMRYGMGLDFGGTHFGEPVTPEFVAQWCKLFLADYGLPIEKKVRVVAHVVYTFGIDAWLEHVHPVCAPYLEGIELLLVNAVCGRHMVPPDPANAWKLLHTVVDLSQESHKDYDAQLAPIIKEESRHADLAMLCELAPPQSRIELYFLAYNALQMDNNAVPSADVLELPELA